MKIGYAYKGSRKHQRLLAGQSPSTIAIDYCLNETMPHVEPLKIAQDQEILVYTLTDLIAEKFRALLQQVERNRQRRQDIFDLALIFERLTDIDPIERQKILEALMQKSRSRGINPTRYAVDDPLLREHAKADYPTLADEVEGELPDFDTSFYFVRQFYLSLPWDEWDKGSR